MVDQGTGLYSQKNIRTSVFFPGRFTLNQSSAPVRNATYLRTFYFFRIYLCLSRDFVNQHVFLLLDLHWDNQKLPGGKHRISGPFVLKNIIMPFKRLFVLWHSFFVFYSSLYFYTSDSFRPIPMLFTHFTLHQFFLVYITTRNICLIPDDAVARNLIIIFNFSSRRPHLNYILLSSK